VVIQNPFMKYTLLVLVAIGMVVSCSKDKFQSSPQLTFKKSSSDFIPVGADLSFTLGFTDAEGDIAGNVRVEKISSSCGNAGYIDSNKFVLPSFPASENQKGDILISMSYAIDLKPIRCSAIDSVETAVFKFWIRDAAGNYSDTATSGPIIIQK